MTQLLIKVIADGALTEIRVVVYVKMHELLQSFVM